MAPYVLSKAVELVIKKAKIMRKLLIAIAAVALLAVPSLGGDLATEVVNVSITVTSYGSISGLGNPGSLSFTVPGPYAGPFGPVYGAVDHFKVSCNVASILTVTADEVSEPSGAPATGLYPTATCTSGAASSLEHRIAFGVALENFDDYQYGAWNPDVENAQVAFSPSMTDDLDPNAKITLNSYMDWARDGDALAPAGDYTTTLTVTLAGPV